MPRNLVSELYNPDNHYTVLQSLATKNTSKKDIGQKDIGRKDIDEKDAGEKVIKSRSAG